MTCVCVLKSSKSRDFSFLKTIFILVRINGASPPLLKEWLHNKESKSKREKTYACRCTHLHENICVPVYAHTQQYTFTCIYIFMFSTL